MNIFMSIGKWVRGSTSGGGGGGGGGGGDIANVNLSPTGL